MGRRSRRAAFAAGLTAGLVAASAAAAGDRDGQAGAAMAGQATLGSPAEVRSYWTRARMMQARPLAGAAPAAARRPSGQRSEDSPGYVPPAAPGEAGGPLRRGGGLAQVVASAVDPGDERTFPNRLHGRVFLTMDGADLTCSGTAVSSPGRSLVVSAGHCAYDSGWASNWAFVPGYRDGRAPFGR